jgi:tryptophan-rich sensory protein
LLLFLALNFGGLALGNMFMGDAVNGKWYINLNKAPWTPPGWVFGVAWTTIMICFSIYLSYLFSLRSSRYVLAIYCLALVLNVSWNYFFFNQNLTSVALFVLIFLLLVIIYFFISFGDEELSKMKYLLLPYIIWLCIAISLNGYVVLKNWFK